MNPPPRPSSAQKTLGSNTLVEGIATWYFSQRTATGWDFPSFRALVKANSATPVTETMIEQHWTLELDKKRAGGSEVEIEHANNLLRSRKRRRGAPKSANSPSVYTPSSLASSDNEGDRDIPEPNGDVDDCLRFLTQRSGVNVQLPSGQSLQECINKALREHSLTPEHYVNLTKNVIFPNSPGYQSIFDNGSADLKFLQRRIPKPPAVPPKFSEFCESFKNYIEQDGRVPLPLPPPSLSTEELALYRYIRDVVLHTVENYDTIIARSPSHGETYDIIHIWGRTLDAAFLHSKYLTMDRSEMKSSVDKDGFQRCYDGIIRSLSPFTRWDIGFVEVKSCDKSVELDKVKIIDVLIRSLNGISKVVTNNDVMVQVLVFGICCQGVEMTVYSVCRAWDQVFLCDEFKYDYSKEADPLFQFLDICWSLKLACENTYELIKSSSRKAFSGAREASETVDDVE